MLLRFPLSKTCALGFFICVAAMVKEDSNAANVRRDALEINLYAPSFKISEAVDLPLVVEFCNRTKEELAIYALPAVRDNAMAELSQSKGMFWRLIVEGGNNAASLEVISRQVSLKPVKVPADGVVLIKAEISSQVLVVGKQSIKCVVYKDNKPVWTSPALTVEGG